VVLCFGQWAGNWVRQRLNANTLVDQFIETNNRRWRSNSFIAPSGIAVVVTTHPSIADWATTAADPSRLAAQLLHALM